MFTKTQKNPIVSIILGFTIIAFVLGLWTYLYAESDKISACATKTGSLYLIGNNFLKKECSKNHTPISWGTQGWDEARIVQLENRVAELEKKFPMPKTVVLWENFNPITDETEGTFIDVERYTSAVLHFDWQSGVETHTCQYKYLHSADGVTPTFDSTFLYFSPATCTGTAVIPIGTKFLKINAWTPPSGVLNATLELSN